MAIKSSAQEQAAANNKYYRATGFSTIKAFFGNYFNFTGRSSRSEYWWVILFGAILSIVAMIGFIVAVVGSAIGLDPDTMSPAKIFGHMGIGLVIFLLLVILVALVLLVPSLALLIRRYRDAGIPWWIYLVQLLINASTNFMPKDSTVASLLSWAVSLSILILTLLPSKPLPNLPADDTGTRSDLDSRIDPNVFAAPTTSVAPQAPKAPETPKGSQASEAPEKHDDPDHPYTEG
ncbi:DUF805 domain-containing protein [Lacticaseibacillus camelliae]|uniref:DUF805 domain-containing protein n=1 Tax=Lacticaseibacillus camelliae DSM 22697 = JCM 13995 TaxID=1423730 RepID=A0A0R2FEE2_9LACO|nr:DUF805 domain-containing protein [Lacticaseibacillus camelliae]KRN23324.1 hypothetical protein FC75_GL001524 [Lacticaseibacillus camelliae DSM 22697 = JCM 13995]